MQGVGVTVRSAMRSYLRFANNMWLGQPHHVTSLPHHVTSSSLRDVIKAPLMVQNPQVPAHDLILKQRAGGNIDSLTVIGDDDNSSSQRHIPPEIHIPRDRQVIKFQQVRDRLESGRGGFYTG